MTLPGYTETGQSTGGPSANPHTVHPESSPQASASYMPGINIPILTGPENHSKWESRMKVHFMGIGIISILYAKEKNPTVEGQANYETFNNKGVASIYAKINDDCIELIQDCFDTATIISKLRSQFADKDWGSKSTTYLHLHQISFVECLDKRDYVSQLRSAHYRLANMGLIISTNVWFIFSSWD